MSDQTAAEPAATPSKPEHLRTPGNGSTSLPVIVTTVRQDGLESSKVCSAVPPSVTCAWLKPCRAGAHHPSEEVRRARSTVAAQYARPATVACTTVSPKSAHVPPFTVGTSELPSRTKSALGSSRSSTRAVAGRTSCLSESTTTAQRPSSSASDTRWRAPASTVSDRPPPLSTARVPASSTLSVCPPPRVTVEDTGPGTGAQSSIRVAAGRTAGAWAVPPEDDASAVGVPVSEGLAG